MRQAKPAVVRGAVAQLCQHARVSGTGNGVGTTYDVTFSIGLQHVQLSMDSPPAIQEGDDVAVAGERSVSGILYGNAYRNFTRSVYPDRPSNGMYVFGIVVLVVIPIALLVVCGAVLLFGKIEVLALSAMPAVALVLGLNGLRRANASRSAFEVLSNLD